jgi:hypothetical protein
MHGLSVLGLHYTPEQLAGPFSACQRRAGRAIFTLHSARCPHRLAVRTDPSHGSDRGSIPREGTSYRGSGISRERKGVSADVIAGYLQRCRNTTSILVRFYRELLRQDEAEAWFAVLPHSSANLLAYKQARIAPAR